MLALLKRYQADMLPTELSWLGWIIESLANSLALDVKPYLLVKHNRLEYRTKSVLFKPSVTQPMTWITDHLNSEEVRYSDPHYKMTSLRDCQKWPLPFPSQWPAQNLRACRCRPYRWRCSRAWCPCGSGHGRASVEQPASKKTIFGLIWVQNTENRLKTGILIWDLSIRHNRHHQFLQYSILL